MIARKLESRPVSFDGQFDEESGVFSRDSFLGKYRIVRKLGEGGMAAVYEAVHTRLGRTVAIKVLHEHMRESSAVRYRFEREARAAAQLKGPNTARVMDVDSLEDGTPFIVMEYLDGVSLEAELGRRGRFSAAESIDIVLQACNAIREAHRHGIVHRDLKPENLFLQKTPRGYHVKVLDFGISKVATDRDFTEVGTVLGSPSYMSPEQIRSAGEVDPRSDIWSLGVVLFELMTGATPFRARTVPRLLQAITSASPARPEALVPGLPEAVGDIVLKALAKDPNQRYASIQDFAESLRAQVALLRGHRRGISGVAVSGLEIVRHDPPSSDDKRLLAAERRSRRERLDARTVAEGTRGAPDGVARRGDSIEATWCSAAPPRQSLRASKPSFGFQRWAALMGAFVVRMEMAAMMLLVL